MAKEAAIQFDPPPPPPPCLHRRLIDDVLTEDGQRTGKVRCVECGAIFEELDHPFG